MAIDKCDICKTYECQIQNAEDEQDHDRKEEMLNQFKYHMKCASFGYQANKSLIRWSYARWKKILNVPDDVKIMPRLSIYQLKTFIPFSPIHVTIDWDKDRNEIQRQFKRFYGSIKPQFVSLNIKISPSTEKGLLISTDS